MAEDRRDPPDTFETTRETLLDAAIPHVPFDGWGETTFRMALADSGVDPALARAACPQGGLDLAVALHRRGDRRMEERLSATDLSSLRFRDRVTTAIRLRLEAAEDPELVRRAAALFALPQNAGQGAALMWGTADRIWTALGDRSDDLNWYSKRATLSGVFAATVLYWLGDQSPGHAATWEFLDRRIAGVMAVEKAKAQARKAPGLSLLMRIKDRVDGCVHAPRHTGDLPGHIQTR